MNNNEKYDLLADGEKGLASNMAIFPRDRDFVFEATQMEKSLAENKDFRLLSFAQQEDAESVVAAYTARIEYNNDEFDIDIYIDRTENITLSDYGFGNSIDAESIEQAQSQPYFLVVSMFFGEDSLSSFHLQLKILDAIVPDASLCIDFMSYRLLSPQWLGMTARSEVPPSPDYLYNIHCVYDDIDGVRYYWFHTHGLHRCGTIELEMVNVSQSAEQMHTLLNMAVTKFLTDPVKEKERFMIGYDGMGIDLCWLRWEEALKDFAPDILGGWNERMEDGSVHAEPVGVLYAVQDGNMISPEIYGKTLADNPIYYISESETFRMSCLAKERFGFFKQVFDKEAPKPQRKSLFGKLFGSNNKPESNWRFLVKLGLDTDNPDSGSGKEHLWYDVIAIDEENNIKGELLNQPYWISNLHEGDVKTYPIDTLTDWIIYGPDNTYTSDTIYQLGFN